MMFDLTDHYVRANDLDDEIEKTVKRLETLHAEAARLQSLEPVTATPHWRKDSHGQPRYLYLIYPQKDGQRERTYVGSDPVKVAAALDRVQAARDLTEMLGQIKQINARLDRIARYLSAALATAREGR